MMKIETKKTKENEIRIRNNKNERRKKMQE